MKVYNKEDIKQVIINFLECNLGELESVIHEIFNFSGELDELRYFDNDKDFFDSFFDNPSEVITALSEKYSKYDEFVHVNDNLMLESLNEEEYQDMLLDNVEKVVDTLLKTDVSCIYLTDVLEKAVLLYQKYNCYSAFIEFINNYTY